MALPGTYITAKNALADGDAWVLLVEIEYNTGEYQRFAINQNEDITWNGSTWVGFPAEIDTIQENRNELPQLVARVCNVNRLVQAKIEEYDGAVDCPLNIYVVHTGNLSETTNVPTFNFVILGTRCTAMWVSFTIGMDISPYRVRDPKNRILKNFCRFGFPNSRDARCPYTGATYTTCDRTLAACIERNGDSSSQFGGFPAIGSNTIYV